MKAVIVSLIARLVVILGVLAFVFAIVYVTGNTKFLWLLFLLVSVFFIPTYTYTENDEPTEANKEDI